MENGLTNILELEIANIIEFSFSPLENYITVLSRYGKLDCADPVKPAENTAPMKNLQVYDVKTKEIVLAFTLKNLADWKIEWTEDESFCARLAPNEVQLFDSRDFKKGVSSAIKIEGIQSFSLSPGKRQTIAVFLAGKNVVSRLNLG